MADPLKPSLSLLVRLGSIIVHADEATSKKRHAYDLNVFQLLLSDPEVRDWIDAMRKLALVPEKR